jgi:hypothetical protein
VTGAALRATSAAYISLLIVDDDGAGLLSLTLFVVTRK